MPYVLEKIIMTEVREHIKVSMQTLYQCYSRCKANLTDGN